MSRGNPDHASFRGALSIKSCYDLELDPMTLTYECDLRYSKVSRLNVKCSNTTDRWTSGVIANGDASRQYLVSWGQNILYPPKCVIVVFIVVNSVLTVHIISRNGWRKNASKCIHLHVTIQNFSGGYAPKPPHWGGAMAPLPKLHAPQHSGAVCLARGLNRPPKCLLAVDTSETDRRDWMYYDTTLVAGNYHHYQQQ